MAGIYIHIPFCKQACHYCDFHFSTNLTRQKQLVDAIIKELIRRYEYIHNHQIESIYFGGGTSSLLECHEIERILKTIRETYIVTEPEITLEANPDDLCESKLKGLSDIGINRLSIGVQTYDDTCLKFLNRSHDSDHAKYAIELAREAGFRNLSIDLIFAIPPEEDSLSRFKNDLHQLINYNPEHISLYNLTIEPKTVLGNWHEKKKFKTVSEKTSAHQYEIAVELLKSAGYEHYEVSNYAKKGKHSRHNSSYWMSAQYLGVGPGAHSYNGESRLINVSNNAQYLRSIENGTEQYGIEILSKIQMLNEYVLTRTRTKWGLDFTYIQDRWGLDLQKQHANMFEKLVEEKKAVIQGSSFRLTSKGFSIADEVTLRLFSEE